MMVAEKHHGPASAVARATAGFLGILLGGYGVWFGARLFGGVGVSKNYVLLPIPLMALAMSTLLLVFSTLGGRPNTGGYLRSALSGGLIVGGAAFIIGFIGPIVFMPDANQGPLLGIVITGPLGFLIGCIAGLWYSLARTNLN